MRTATPILHASAAAAPLGDPGPVLQRTHPWAAFVERCIARAALRDENQTALARRWGLGGESTLRNWTFRPTQPTTSPDFDLVARLYYPRMNEAERADLARASFPDQFEGRGVR